jgi:SAM-dependent methyltransferase
MLRPPAKQSRKKSAAAEAVLAAASQPLPYHQWLFSRVREHVRGRVLEVGSRRGEFTRFLAAKASYVTALEPSAELAREIECRLALPGRVHCLCGTLDDLPVPQAERDLYDAVVSFNYLDRVGDDVASLQAMAAQLRPGGRVVAVVSPDGQQQRRYTIRSLRVAMEVAGLTWKTGGYADRLGRLGVRTGGVALAKLVDRVLPLPFGAVVVGVGAKPGGDGEAIDYGVKYARLASRRAHRRAA